MENPPPVTPSQSSTVQPQKSPPDLPVIKPIEEKKPKNKLVPLLAFLFIVALGVAGYFGWQNYQLRLEKETTDVQPEPSPVVADDEVEDWQTYTNNDYKLSFKYPQNWQKESSNIVYEIRTGCDPDTFRCSQQKNVVEIRSNSSKMFKEYTNKEWFNHIANLNEKWESGRDVFLKFATGQINTDESYVIFKQYPSPNFEGEPLDLIIGYILSGDSIKELRLSHFETDQLGKQLLTSMLDSAKILSTFKTVDVSAKKRICPDEWILNTMPGTVTPSPIPREYLIINAKREEIINYDLSWIKSNCSVKEPQVVH